MIKIASILSTTNDIIAALCVYSIYIRFKIQLITLKCRIYNHVLKVDICVQNTLKNILIE